MAYAEKRGKGPKPWRVKYQLPNGRETSESGFETKQAALEFGRDEEAKMRSGTWTDQKAGQITLTEWIELWLPLQDVGISTIASREYLIRRFIVPELGSWRLASLTTADVTKWEMAIPTKFGVQPSTARSARAVLCTILGDAAGARPPRLPFNPALRPRNRGRRTGRKLSRSPQRPWTTPLEALLIGERAALLSGVDDDFVLVQTLAYTGMRWGEAIGLEREFVTRSLINVEWQLRELGQFHRLPPKDDSYRSENWNTVPLDLPPFLAHLLAKQIARQPHQQCACVAKHGGSGLYVFTGPRGGHYRRGRYAALIFRPACDGRYPSKDGRQDRVVVVDASTPWPGTPAAKWPAAISGQPYAAPAGRGVPRLVSSQYTGRCPACKRTMPLRQDDRVILHKVGSDYCPGSRALAIADPPLACWLPVKRKVTPHGLRHSLKTWMAEDGIPEILAEQRLGHDIPGIRGLYVHVSDRMRQDLTAALQARWEEALQARAAICPCSPVPVLDELLQKFRADTGTDNAQSIAAVGSRRETSAKC